MENILPGVSLETNIMEANQILQSDILDVIFDGKNKSYGAYDLRKTYNGRVSLALFLMFALMGLFISARFFFKKEMTNVVTPWISKDYVVTDLPRENLPIPPAPPEKTIPVEKISTVHYSSLKISPNEEVLIPPPSMDEIETSRVGFETFKGIDEMGIIHPPVGEPGTKILAVPVDKKDDADEIVMDVQIEASVMSYIL